MIVGRIYLLKGGDVLRYQGPWGKDSCAPLGKHDCLAFADPSQGVSSPASGTSIARSYVLQEVTARDIPWLLRREQQQKARGLHAWAETRRIIEEVEKRKVEP